MGFTNFVQGLASCGADRSGIGADDTADSRVILSGGKLYLNGSRWRAAGFNFSRSSCRIPNAQAAAVARRLKVLGCNCARFQSIDSNTDGVCSAWPAIDTSQIVYLEYFLNQLKLRGVHSYFVLHFAQQDQAHRHTSLYMPASIAAQKTFIDNLLGRVNPYTNLTWGNDPAVAVYEIINEAGCLRSYFTDEFEGVLPEETTELDGQWNAWLLNKYGTQAALESAWGGTGFSGTNGQGLGSISHPVYNTGNTGASYYADRSQQLRGDWIDFLIHLETTYFSDLIAHVRARTAALVICGQVNYMANHVAANGDIIDTHAYFDRPSYFNATELNGSNVIFTPGPPATIQCPNKPIGNTFPVGSTLRVSGSVLNNSVFTVAARDSSIQIQVQSVPMLETAVGPVTFQAETWTQGNIPWIGSSSTLGYIGDMIGRAQHGKPFFVTEHNYGGFNQYSAESLITWLAIASLQDWDGVFIHNYSNGAGGDYDAQYVIGDLRSDKNPTKTAFFQVFSAAFRQGLILPLPAVENEILAPDDERNLTEGYTANQSDVRFIRASNGTSIEYHPSRLFEKRLYTTPGQVSTFVGSAAALPTPIQSAGSQVVYDATAGQESMLVRAASCKGFVGYIDGRTGLDLGDQVLFDPPAAADGDWFAFLMSLVAGQGLEQGGRWLIASMGKWRNQNMVFDVADTGLHGWGDTAVQVDQQPCTLTIPVHFSRVTIWPMSPDGVRQSPIVVNHGASGNAQITLNGSAWYELEVSKPVRKRLLANARLPAPASANIPHSGVVIITGTATEGQVLTADTSGISDANGLGPFSYQWYRSGNSIPGATGATYTLVEADVGLLITVAASFTDGSGNPESSSSAATAAVVNLNQPVSGSVTIDIVNPTEGDTLTADASGLSDTDGLGTFSYQWNRSGAPISGASANTYTAVEADVGAQLTVTVTYTDGHGTVESVNSAPTAAVVNLNQAPSGTVTISGVAQEGVALTASNNLTDTDGIGSITYAWKSSADSYVATISSGTSYTPVSGDVGNMLRVTATYTDGHGTVESVNSAPTAAVASQSSGNINWFHWNYESYAVNTDPDGPVQYPNNIAGSYSFPTTDPRQNLVSHSGSWAARYNVPSGVGNQPQLGVAFDATLDWGAPSYSTPNTYTDAPPIAGYSANTFVGGPAVYYRWWMRFDSGFSWGDDPAAKIKFSRVITDFSPQVYTGYIGLRNGNPSIWLDERDATVGADTQLEVADNRFFPADDLWHEYIVMVQGDSTPGAGDGSFRVWMDGVESSGGYDGTALHSTHADSKFGEGWEGWGQYIYPQLNGTAGNGGLMYVDDISVDSTFNTAGGPYGVP